MGSSSVLGTAWGLVSTQAALPTLELACASRDLTTDDGPAAEHPVLVDDLPLPVLEVEITTLAGHLAAATCRFLLLLASFDTREGWGGAGCARVPTGCPGGAA